MSLEDCKKKLSDELDEEFFKVPTSGPPKFSPKRKTETRKKSSKGSKLRRNIKRHAKSSNQGSANQRSKALSKKQLQGPKIGAQLASIENIAILLRSEQVSVYVKSGTPIPAKAAYGISRVCGFRSVGDLNDYIIAHRRKFIVLVDNKERECNLDGYECNSFKRTDSVDLGVYFAHHYGLNF